jgi:hypothetical protein
VLSFLISARWTVGEAAGLGVGVGDGAARKQLSLYDYEQREGVGVGRFPMEGKLQKAFAGAPTADRVWLMKLSMLVAGIEHRRFADAKHQVTPADIAAYYEAHKSRYVSPERRDLVWIVTFDKKILSKALREVRSGKSLISVAERVSLDPPTITGLTLASAREKAFARRVFAAKPHVLTGPLRQHQNVYAFEVTSVVPAHRWGERESAAAIRQELASRRLHDALFGSAATFAKVWTARTSCSARHIVLRCKQFNAAALAGTRLTYLEV